MGRSTLEVADIFRDHGAAWRKANAGHVSLGQLKVMSAIESCRTAVLGGHVARCEDCAHQVIAYNSCRNRHCPKCHMWTAAPGKHFFDVSNDLVDCGHMSGLFARSIFPLALMKSDNLDPYQGSELFAHGTSRVVPDLRWRPCRSSRLFALAKLEPVYLPCELRVPATSGFLTPSQTSRFGSIRRSSSSPRESGPTCWLAPPLPVAPAFSPAARQSSRARRLCAYPRR